MFACPHCQFQNPIQNRFCQRCGKPLKGLRVIITRTVDSIAEPARQSSPPAGEGVVQTLPSKAALPLASATLADLLTAERYLDTEKRYQLRYPGPLDRPLPDEFELEVIDCQPASPPPVKGEPVAVENGSEPPPEPVLSAFAYPYWKLQEQLIPAIPELQAAWQTQGYAIVVIEDRTAWQRLADIWAAPEKDPLEQLNWFYEMVALWESLAAFRAESSLLSLPNLLIDEDQILCLRRLLYSTGDRGCSIQDLGLLWQSLPQQPLDSRLAALQTLVANVATGEITELAAIKEGLSSIAEQMQAAPATGGPHDEPDDEPGDGPDADGIDEDTLPAPDLLSTEEEPTEPVTLPFLALEEDDLGGSGFLEPDDAFEEEPFESDEDSICDLPTMALPMKLYRLDEAGQTHVGRQRNHNEDSFSFQTNIDRAGGPAGATIHVRGLYILCDGMGGHAGGEIASRLALATLQDYFAAHWKTDLPDEETIRSSILQANQVIFEQNEAEDRVGSARMGTTLVMVLVADNQAVVAHVGDSRLYIYTRQGLKQITTDHEVGQREIARGVDVSMAYARQDAYQLTQALGPRDRDDVVPHIETLHIGQDTLLLLCSDGLSDNDLLEKHTETHVKPLLSSRADLEEGVANLIDLANQHNGHDNITAIAVRMKMRPNFEALQD